MNTVKNLQVNKKARCLNKKTVLRLIIGAAMIGTIITTPIVAVNAHNNRVEEQQKTSVVTYYGEDSIENRIIEYIEVSEKLNKLNLESFDIDESLYKKHNISEQLKSPKEINEYIEKFKNINSYISSKDITKQSKNIDIVLNLAAQEKFVNSFIYNIGYSTANQNITSATKKYAAEVFGIEDPTNVYFNYHTDAADGESSIKVVNKTLSENKSYIFDSFYQKKEEKAINNGVISMDKTDVLGDKLPDDNEIYNKDRNKIIREVLADSVNLENQVENYDLYNEKMANKMK